MSAVLIRVPVPALDETYLGVEVLISGVGPDGATRSVHGGISDVLRVEAGTRWVASCGHLHTLPAPLTRVWVGGRTVTVDDDAVILAAPSPTHLDALAASP